jgi:hypothetical protein
VKPHEFKQIRKSFDLSEADFMYLLGYAGNQNTMHLNCRRYEDGQRPIPLYLARYVWLLDRIASQDGVPTDAYGLPVWPEFLGYHDDDDEVKA